MNDDILSRIKRAAPMKESMFSVISLDEYAAAVSEALMPGKKTVEYVHGSDVTYTSSKSIATSGFVVAIIDEDEVTGVDAAGNSLGSFSMPHVPTLDAMYGFDSNRSPDTMSVGSGAISILRRALNVDPYFELVIVERQQQVDIVSKAVDVHRSMQRQVSVFVRQADVTDDVIVFIDGDIDMMDPGENRWRLAGPASLTYAGVIVISAGVVEPRPRCDRITVNGRIVNRVHKRAIDCTSVAKSAIVMFHE